MSGTERHPGIILRVKRDPKNLDLLLDLAEKVEAGLDLMMPHVVATGEVVVVLAGLRQHKVFCNRRIARTGGKRCMLRPGHETACSPLRPDELARDLNRERFGVDLSEHQQWQG